MTPDPKHLRALAEAATTGGKWTARAYEVEEGEEPVGYAAYLRTHEHNGDYDLEEDARDAAEADAALARAVSPATVLALLDEVERLRRIERAAEAYLVDLDAQRAGEAAGDAAEDALRAALNAEVGT